MGRTPNDDRSDSKNPNNPSYWASEANHRHQTGSDDDADDDGPVRPVYRAPVTVTERPALPVAEPREVFVAAVCLDDPYHAVPDLYLRYVLDRTGAEATTKVNSTSIDEAIRDALVLWEKGGLAYLALYGSRTMHLEKIREWQFPLEIAQELIVLGNLEEAARTADKQLTNALHALEKAGSRDERFNLATPVKDFGAWKAARDGLRDELAQRIAGLNVRQVTVSEESVQELAAAAKLAVKADLSVRWMRKFHEGKVEMDPILIALRQPEKIGDIRV